MLEIGGGGSLKHKISTDHRQTQLACCIRRGVESSCSLLTHNDFIHLWARDFTHLQLHLQWFPTVFVSRSPTAQFNELR